MSGKRKAVVIERKKSEGHEDNPNIRTFVYKKENFYGDKPLPNESYEEIIIPSSGSDKEPEVRTVQPEIRTEVDEQYKQAQGLFYSTAEENTEDNETPKATSPQATSPITRGPFIVNNPFDNIHRTVDRKGKRKVVYTSGSEASNAQSSEQSSGSSNKEDKPIIITNLPKPEQVEERNKKFYDELQVSLANARKLLEKPDTTVGTSSLSRTSSTGSLVKYTVTDDEKVSTVIDNFEISEESKEIIYQNLIENVDQDQIEQILETYQKLRKLHKIEEEEELENLINNQNPAETSDEEEKSNASSEGYYSSDKFLEQIEVASEGTVSKQYIQYKEQLLGVEYFSKQEKEQIHHSNDGILNEMGRSRSDPR